MERNNAGDLVQLKSGGPVMTVSIVFEEDSDSMQIRFNYKANKMKYPEAEYIYVCSWFIKDNHGNDQLKEALFPDYLLKKAEFGTIGNC